MNWFSWDQRIRRAEQLAHEYSASAEVLQFYGHVARFQKAVYERLKPEDSPAVLPGCLEPHYRPLLHLIERVGPGPLAKRASELEKDRPTFAELLAVTPTEDLLFFTQVLLQPYMECTVNRNCIPAADGSARCPACGEWPVAAVLRGEGDGARRWLVCSLCSMEWAFRRIVCPFCGEEDPKRLPVYTASAFDHVRVEACDRCHTYIKSVDLTKNGLAVPCVDELATLPMSLWAEENGYHKLQRNVLGL
jgi:FdhE protein